MYSSAINDLEPSIDTGAAADFDEPAPNLEVIYQAFGEHADLYKDVLQVKSSATAEQIQMAYFDRRSELFALLASIDSEEEQDDITASHRFHAERKMDAVVMAVRILGDPQLRQEYDNVMILRQTKKHPKEPPSSSGASRSSSTREPDGVYAGISNPHGEDMPSSPRRGTRSPKRRSPKRRSRRVSPPDNDISDDAKMMASSSDEMMHHHQYHNSQEPDYDFVKPSSSRGSKGSGSSKNKRSHKKKQHSTSYHHESDHHPPQVDQSLDQSTLNQTLDTFPDNTVSFAAGLNDEGTLESRAWDDQGTIASQSTNGDWTRDSRVLARGGTSTLSAVTSGGIVSRIQEEVAGTVEDTLVTFEQVLNVFTLQDRDIMAVMGRIDKAKRQLRKRK